MTEVEKAIEKAKTALAELTQLCRGQQRALDDAAFALTSAAHDAGLLLEGPSCYSLESWETVVPMAVAALQASNRPASDYPGDLIKIFAIQIGYEVLGIEWVTKRSVKLALRKAGDPAVRVLHARTGDHMPPSRVTEALCADLHRKLAKVENESKF